jgi:hypothetical protein
MPTVQHANDRNGIIAMTVLFTVIVIVAVSLRFYARQITRSGFGWDDWTALTALVSF